MLLEAEDQPGGPVMNQKDVNTIFGNFRKIIEVHENILEELTIMAQKWEDISIGQIFLKHVSDMIGLFSSQLRQTSRIMLNSLCCRGVKTNW